MEAIKYTNGIQYKIIDMYYNLQKTQLRLLKPEEHHQPLMQRILQHDENIPHLARPGK